MSSLSLWKVLLLVESDVVGLIWFSLCLTAGEAQSDRPSGLWGCDFRAWTWVQRRSSSRSPAFPRPRLHCECFALSPCVSFSLCVSVYLSCSYVCAPWWCVLSNLKKKCSIKCLFWEVWQFLKSHEVGVEWLCACLRMCWSFSLYAALTRAEAFPTTSSFTHRSGLNTAQI